MLPQEIIGDGLLLDLFFKLISVNWLNFLVILGITLTYEKFV